jgi:hypothetical protein
MPQMRCEATMSARRSGCTLKITQQEHPPLETGSRSSGRPSATAPPCRFIGGRERFVGVQTGTKSPFKTTNSVCKQNKQLVLRASRGPLTRIESTNSHHAKFPFKAPGFFPHFSVTFLGGPTGSRSKALTAMSQQHNDANASRSCGSSRPRALRSQLKLLQISRVASPVTRRASSMLRG